MGNKKGKKNIVLNTEKGNSANSVEAKGFRLQMRGLRVTGLLPCISISFSSPANNMALAFQGQEGHTPPRATTAHTPTCRQ